MIEPLLRVEGLVKHFPVEAGVLGRLFGRRPAQRAGGEPCQPAYRAR